MRRSHSDLRSSLGDWGFQTYQRIEADARNLQEKLQRRGKRPGPGRLKGDEATLGEIRGAALALIKDCATHRIPPPLALVRLLYEAWDKSKPSTTGALRDVQFNMAAEAETASLGVDEQGNVLYRAKIADVAKAAGADRHTIRDWRRTKKYAQAVVEALCGK